MTAGLPAVALDRPFGLPRTEKAGALLAGLNALTDWHRARCGGYARMLDGVFGATGPASCLADVPYLPVRAFKHFDLKSVDDGAVVRRLTSSGTTGQQVSRIHLDAETSALQVRALAAIVQDFLGRARLPMVIIDQEDIARGKASFSARTAGVLGFATFGRQHCYALRDDLRPRWDALEAFIAAHREGPVLLFGFTWVVWQCLLQAAVQAGRRLDFGPGSVLIHGGGWKRLAEQAVDNPTFKRMLRERLGIRRVCNYYGMVEQVGSVFMECEEGHLHAPAFADVLMRDLATLAPAATGAVEVLSLLPRSYPGHALLTEDHGTLLGEDDCPCGRLGKHFLVHGRIPMAELRGCSDVRAL